MKALNFISRLTMGTAKGSSTLNVSLSFCYTEDGFMIRNMNIVYQSQNPLSIHKHAEMMIVRLVV